jgi:hypothetical protein
MKNFKLLLLAFVAILGTSCGDDDGPGFALDAANFAGTYQVTALSGNVTIVEQQSVGGSVTTTLDFTGDTFNNTRFVFNANGTYTSSGSFRETTITRRSGTPDDTDTEIVDLDDQGTFVLNIPSRTVTITDDFGDATVLDISRFNASELFLTSDENETDGDVTITGTTEIRLSRI